MDLLKEYLPSSSYNYNEWVTPVPGDSFPPQNVATRFQYNIAICTFIFHRLNYQVEDVYTKNIFKCIQQSEAMPHTYFKYILQLKPIGNY